MENEKLEDLLNLALDASTYEREHSLELDVGYQASDDTWEVIVKYTGSPEQMRQVFDSNFTDDEKKHIEIYNLSNEYTVLILPERIVDRVSMLDEIEYMEKPKRLFFAGNDGGRVFSSSMDENSGSRSAMAAGSGGQEDDGETTEERKYAGRGVIVGIVDSGIDYAHPDFRNEDGTTRILLLWDQTTDTVYDSATIDLALMQESEKERMAICPEKDISGHGTHVAGIAAGNGRASGGKYRGIAYESDIIAVKLGTSRANGFARTTELMKAVDFCVRKALGLKKPIALNISFGNSYGSHSGTALLETYLNDMANFWRTSIIVGSGNEGDAGGHTSGVAVEGRMEEIIFSVSPYETMLNLQIWKNYVDEFVLELISPNGETTGMLRSADGVNRFTLEKTQILMYYGQPSPYSPYQEIYFDFIPEDEYINEGLWRVRIVPQRVIIGKYDMWLPAGGILNRDTTFVNPTIDTTLTIPSTASGVITVGAYDGVKDSVAGFSGRGYTRETDQVKPDVVAPGVDIVSCAPNGGYDMRSGTSMAAPYVTGLAALMMEWGIVRGNDRYLYGEKLKAYLRKYARHFADGSSYPNGAAGYGKANITL